MIEVFTITIIYLQGAYLLGTTVGIIIYYTINLRRTRRDIDAYEVVRGTAIPYLKAAATHKLKMHVIAIALSYLLFIATTMITLFRAVYPFPDIWYFILFIAYLLGDISLFQMFVIQRDKYKDYEIDTNNKHQK
jgi:ABC-type multidrug transport system permease subunit